MKNTNIKHFSGEGVIILSAAVLYFLFRIANIDKFFTIRIFITAIISLIICLLLHKYKDGPQKVASAITIWAAVTAATFLADYLNQVIHYSIGFINKINSPLTNRAILSIVAICFTALISLLLVRIFSKTDYIAYKKQQQEFIKAFKRVGFIFLCIYILELINGFILIREIDLSGQRNLQLIPFTSFKEITSNLTPFQQFCQFAGNIFLLTPIGFIMEIKRDKKPGILYFILPVILSFCIEAIQYILNTGYADIDDLIMNTAGYFLGPLFAVICKFIRRKITNSKDKNIFNGFFKSYH